MLKIFVFLIMLLCGGTALSSGPSQPLTLPWAVKSEQLVYRSCGCADSCWVAELRTRKPKRVKAILRCDCSSLYVTYPMNKPERQFAESCSVINDDAEKMSTISEEMKRIIEGR